MIIVTNLEHDSVLALSILKLICSKNKTKIDGICIVEEDHKWEAIKKANKWLPMIDFASISRYDYTNKICHDTNFPKWINSIIKGKSHYTIVNMASFHILSSLDSSILERINLVTYGGNNLSSLICNNSADLLKKFLRLEISTCTIFDKNYILHDTSLNTINQYTNQQLYSFCMALNTNMTKVLTESIYSWNAHQLYYSLIRLKSRLIDPIEVQDVYDKTISCTNMAILQHLNDRDAIFVCSMYETPFQLLLRNTLVAFYLEKDFVLSVDFVDIDVSNSELKTDLNANSNVALVNVIDMNDIHGKINNYFYGF